MSGMIDKLYINFVSSQLARFKWIRGNVALCKCPFCGDGKKGTRTRFYIYEEVKHSTYRYNCECKNCGQSSSFYNFLKDFDPGLFKDYKLELFREKYGREPRDMFKEAEPVQVEQKLEVNTLEHTIKLTELPDDHFCKVYVRDRKIPEKYFDVLAHTDDFKALAASYVSAEKALKIPDNEKRLIIPFYNEFGELLCLQGRSLDPANKIRYVTLKRDDKAQKVFGMDRIDRSQEVRVCEGPIDSLFVRNCLATADADLTKVKGDVYLYDNQYRNKDVCRHIEKAIESGVRVVLFPSSFIWKDVNEAIQDGGLTMDQIETIIRENTFQGLKAKLVFSKLRGST